MGLRLIDIAANLTDKMFRGMYSGKPYHAQDLQAVLQRAWDAGLDRIIITGGSLQESREALEIAETDGRLYCTVGVHPTRCQEFEEQGNPEEHFHELLALAREGYMKGKVVAIGECGLDYDRLQFCPADIQQKYFEKQFLLAEATHLPMLFHMRAAAKDFLDIIKCNHHRFVAGVVHSFTGTAEERDQILDIDKLYIGINGCSLKNVDNLQVVSAIPVDRMMIETDCPYCEIKPTHAGFTHVKSSWPSKKKEKHDRLCTVKGRCEPCYVRQVLEVVTGYRGAADMHSFSRTLYETTCRVFFPQDLDTAAGVVLSGETSLFDHNTPVQ